MISDAQPTASQSNVNNDSAQSKKRLDELLAKLNKTRRELDNTPRIANNDSSCNLTMDDWTTQRENGWCLHYSGNNTANIYVGCSHTEKVGDKYVSNFFPHKGRENRGP